MNENISELTKRVERYAASMVKPARYKHSVRTAQTAVRLCGLYGGNAENAYLAGVAHDMCKEMDDQFLLALASADGQPISIIEQKKPSLLHGRAAAVLLQRDFSCRDADILEAVRNHTFGRPGMSQLAKIMFVSDKIEPGRPQVTEEYYSNLFSKPLDELVYAVLEENISFLRKQGKTVSLLSLEFLDSFSRSDKSPTVQCCMEELL